MNKTSKKVSKGSDLSIEEKLWYINGLSTDDLLSILDDYERYPKDFEKKVIRQVRLQIDLRNIIM